MRFGRPDMGGVNGFGSSSDGSFGRGIRDGAYGPGGAGMGSYEPAGETGNPDDTGCPKLETGGKCIGGMGMLPPAGLPLPPSTCLAAGETVLMFNGDEVDVVTIREGDELMGMDCEGLLSKQLVTQIREFLADCIEVRTQLGSFVCSTGHFLVDERMDEVAAISLEPGSLLKGQSGAIKVLSVKAIGQRKVCAFECVPDHTFISKGLLHHNKVVCFEELPWPDNPVA